MNSPHKLEQIMLYNFIQTVQDNEEISPFQKLFSKEYNFKISIGNLGISSQSEYKQIKPNNKKEETKQTLNTDVGIFMTSWEISD